MLAEAVKKYNGRNWKKIGQNYIVIKALRYNLVLLHSRLEYLEEVHL